MRMFRWLSAAVLVLGIVGCQIADAMNEVEMELLERVLERAEEKEVAGGQPLSIVDKVTWQSSTQGSYLYPSSKAVDGSSSAILYPDAKCSHTAGNSKNPWWMVDLGEEHCISKVRILNRGDCCSERLAGANVRAGNSPTATDNPTCGSHVTAAQANPHGGTIVFDCSSPLRARYISVDIPRTGTLQLCEVTAEEVPLDQCATKRFGIVGKPATQSSSHGSGLYPAGKAVDGSSSTILYPDSHCSHTNNERNPWWRVDLGSQQCVTKVTILNRGDCCSERLKNAIVRAGSRETVIGNQACGAPITADQAQPLGGTIVVECGRPLRARYVSVDIPGTATLQLCEVYVEVLSSGQC
ncbi:pentraxin fusion protein-like [Patiria miniata]|uniref:Fucolectin tachylectin-4 pentraxin-1 domain-containing protein n=1 Tax=Patiria miniata TaxID=46514 RepID=A0A914AWQ2_PATMI|nr:pentraxin fusion protein-like [Patiria miniata]